eukprot:TRINITY_DN4133_c0_g2_i1.p1 TRINITY_DN4133_c0_g2~~TRINITY_DN4133_c0_g2_i1.p1  ORF type:complete len:358 (-),score=79.39 TRINITY_DN4133_c0_g2_i1:173-1246(-)
MSQERVEDELLVNRVRDLLKEVDLNTWTERQLRECLENEFSTSLSNKKELVRQEIEEFLLQNSTEAELNKHMQSKKRPQTQNISPEMQEFMDTKTSNWHEVLNAVWKHIRENNLQDPNDRREINLDEKLALICTAPLTISSLASQLKRHVLEDEIQPQKKPRGPLKLGFMRPLRLSVQLRELLGIHADEQVSRGDLSKKFWDYFRNFGLQDPKDLRWINCDDNLRSLLGTHRFQAFSIQRLCKRHVLGYLGDDPSQKEVEQSTSTYKTDAVQEEVEDPTPNSNLAEETQPDIEDPTPNLNLAEETQPDIEDPTPNLKQDEEIQPDIEAAPSTASGFSEQIEVTQEPEGAGDEQVDLS